MLYACIGAHRSGKTTTAKKIASEMGIDFVDSSFDVATKFGFNPLDVMTLDERLLMQMQVMTHHIETITAETVSRPAITDRTPLDFFAYTMAEYGIRSHHHTDELTLKAVREFTDVCVSATFQHYDMVFLLDPLPVYEVDTSKVTPAANPAFQYHIDALIRGALMRAQRLGLNYATLPVMPQDERVQFICEQIATRMNEIHDLKRAVGMH